MRNGPGKSLVIFVEPETLEEVVPPGGMAVVVWNNAWGGLRLSKQSRRAKLNERVKIKQCLSWVDAEGIWFEVKMNSDFVVKISLGLEEAEKLVSELAHAVIDWKERHA